METIFSIVKNIQEEIESKFVSCNITTNYFIKGFALKTQTREAVFLTYYSNQIQDKLKIGKQLIFSDGSKRLILKTEVCHDMLVIFYNGDFLDGTVVGYPNEITINPLESFSEVSLNTFDSEMLKRYFCILPFRNADIEISGDVLFCCPMYTNNYSIGNIYTDTIENIWNGEKAKKFRYSVCKGNFEYCNNDCFFLLSAARGETCLDYSALREREQFSSLTTSNEDYTLNNYPEEITLLLDASCNLHCRSCRKEVYMMNREESEKLYDVLINKIKPLLCNCKVLHLMPSGEFLASAALLKFMGTLTRNEFPLLKYGFVTNGQLFSKNKWDHLNSFNGIPIASIMVSIDASNKETYESLRLGAHWETLLQNLDFIKSLRSTKTVRFLGFNFVVQKSNYLQMEDFVEFASQYRVDVIYFQRINCAMDIDYSDSEKNELDVCCKDNLHYSEVVEIFERISKNNRGITINHCLGK